MPCDDGCPNKENVHGYGGWQTLTRSILFRANKLSVRCPGLTRKRKCNQFKMAAVLRRMRRWLVAIDGSGSLRESVFKLLKNFAAGLIDKS